MSVAQENLVSLKISNDLQLTIEFSALPLLALVALIVIVIALIRWWFKRSGNEVLIDSAEFGFGDSKIVLKPNRADRQIAYSIWVELSTRKIGLEIDPENDVLYEIYESWYSFFGVTRELIKGIPADKLGNETTAQIVSLSIQVLNEGLRPHLTQWQARFKHWYERKIATTAVGYPQDIQKDFPAFEALTTDLLNVNQRLIRYRSKMYEILSGKSDTTELKID